jgi:thioesterase domain-containing protein
MSDAMPSSAVKTPDLGALAALLAEEIPLSAQMGVAVDSFDTEGLTVSMPLALNRNPHQTAFAGSLNALCTIAGWGMTHLLLENLGIPGSTVLRRSSIKYRTPVQTPRVEALCLTTTPGDLAYFTDMLSEKGQAKLEHVVKVMATEEASNEEQRPAVLFSGSYVVFKQ